MILVDNTQNEYFATRKRELQGNNILALQVTEFSENDFPTLIELGYNTLITPHPFQHPHVACYTQFSWPPKSLESPFSNNFQEGLVKSFEKINTHGVFYESLSHHPQVLDEIHTLQDVYQKELEVVENILLKNRKKLIFSVKKITPQKIIEWLTKICQPETAIAYEGEYKPQNTTEATLLPILNIGQIGKGEGLWPTIPFDIFEFYLKQKDFTGSQHSIATAHHLPKGKGCLHLALWSFSQYVKKNQSLDFLIEKWIYSTYYQVDRSILGVSLWTTTLKLSRQIIISLDIIRYNRDEEEVRLRAENILNEIVLIQRKAQSEPLLEDYIRYFVRDVRRIIIYILQEKKIPLVNFLLGGDLNSSFWSESHEFEGLKIILRNRPQFVSNDNKMKQIFLDN